MQQLYVGFYAQDTWKLSPKVTLNYGVRWEPGLAQQIRNGAIYNFSVDRFSAGEDDSVCERASRFPVSRRCRIHERQGRHGEPVVAVLAACRHRVGSEGRRPDVGPNGLSLSYDFVNAQFHLNTSVAPPFNAEARVDNPVGGFDNPWLGTGNENFFLFTTGPNSVFPLTGPYISIPPDIKPPRQQSWNLSVQRQIGNDLAVSATYIGTLLRSTVERAFAQPRRLHSRLVHVADRHRAAVLPGVLGQHEPRSAPPVDDGGLRRTGSIWVRPTSTRRSARRSTTESC